MSLHCDRMTRGSGKIYARFVWDDQPGVPFTIRAHASTKLSETVPALVRELPGKNSCVVVLAIFEVPQTLTVEMVRSDTGEIMATAKRRIAPLDARVRSSFNTLRKDEDAESIRNWDEKSRDRAIDIRFGLEVFSGGSACDIMHGSVVVRSDDDATLQKMPTLRFYDNQGRLCDDGAWTLMGDSTTQVAHTSGYVRTIAFSVRVLCGFTSLACWALLEPPSGPRQTRLACLRPIDVAEKREYWADFTRAAQVDPQYEDWFLSQHRTLSSEIEFQRGTRFEIEPLFSIVVPLYQTPLAFFNEMLDSVMGQSYPNFELILVNASPENHELAEAVRLAASADERVRVVGLEKNLGIVGNTYRGVAVAQGDFVSFFDHDDVLEPDLLYRYVEGINEYPQTDLLYCDEDKLCDGKYLSPFFKPDWSPNLLCSSNYVCHMLTVRKSIVDMVAPLEPGVYDGSQDHFLTLFAGEHARNVYHARKVLYHWRMHSQSTASGSATKSYTEEAGIRAVQAHLDRCGIHAVARASGVAPNTYHVDYILDEHPLVSIIIPNKDMAELLIRCVESILDTSTYQNYEIIIVENNSTKSDTFLAYKSLEERDRRIRVVYQASDGSFNFSKTVNYGASFAKGSYLLFLNNDTEVISKNWIESMLGPTACAEVGIVGAKLLYPDGLIQHAGVMVHKKHGAYHIAPYLPADSPHHYCSIQLTGNYSAVTGACLLVKRSLYDELGGFDEDLPVDYNDIDFCLRARERGALVVYEPEAVLKHYESISRGENKPKNRAMVWYRSIGCIMQRWPSYYAEGDPYINPNLQSSAYHKLEWG